MVAHPCFECSLPDCDDRSPRCELRQALNEYSREKYHGRRLSGERQQRYVIAYREIYGSGRSNKRKQNSGH